MNKPLPAALKKKKKKILLIAFFVLRWIFKKRDWTEGEKLLARPCILGFGLESIYDKHVTIVYIRLIESREASM